MTLFVATARPWPGRIRVFAGSDVTTLQERLTLDAPASVGRLLEPLGAGPMGRWDYAYSLLVEMPGGDLSSTTRSAVLAGANRIFVEGPAGWELISFLHAELVDVDVWRLHGLLRGGEGTQPLEIASGARTVLADTRLQMARFNREEIGLDLTWRANEADPFIFAYNEQGGLPLTVGHLKQLDDYITWTRRSRDVPENWTLPEAVNHGDYQVEWLANETLLSAEQASEARIIIHDGADLVRVAQHGTDGRVGPWVSISLNAP